VGEVRLRSNVREKVGDVGELRLLGTKYADQWDTAFVLVLRHGDGL